MGSSTSFYTDLRHIAFLIIASKAQDMTKPVKIDQSEDITDPGIPERSFVKFVHRRSFAFSCRASPLCVLLASFCRVPQLTKRLE